VPDIMVMGKGMSGAVTPSPLRFDRNSSPSSIRTCSSTSRPTAANGLRGLLAMLDQITEPGFLEHVREMGDRFAAGFERLRHIHPTIFTGVRQRGLMIGLEMASDSCGPLMTRAMGEHGVIAIFSHLRPSSLQIMPPLIITPMG
jgi:acetylornithine/succinyldiaminopimelate/putrescine aminotransferase